MSKSSGLGDGLVVDGIDLSGDTGGLQAIGSSRPTTGVTGIDKSAQERIHLRRDGRIDWSSWFNPSNAHDELSTLPTTDRIVTYLRGRTLGNRAASMVAKQLNYDPTRNADGSLTIGLQARANGFGLEWGKQLTAGIRTDSGATNGTGVDFGADAAGMFDAQAYLQVLAFTGTDVTVKIQSSNDDGVVDPWNDRIEFTQITTGPQAQRATQTTPATQLMERFLRVITETTGGFSDLQFVVAVTVNQREVLF